MPIFEYVCRECNHRFELLVQGSITSRVSGVPGHDAGKTIFLVWRRRHRRVGPPSGGGGACGSCGDPRGPGACSMN